jgi:glycosyltransferase involved in cell wall biosynthesis
VADGVTGLLAEPRDEVSFADAIEQLARDKNLRQQMGAQGLARVKEKFSLEVDTENTLRIYDSLSD